jgi:hydroxymethylpyrimidine pyrophosphatase-like HAD family hydrolase
MEPYLQVIRKLQKKVKKLYGNAKMNGNYIAYITGRGTIKTRKFVTELPCDAYACNNGSQIFCDDKLIQSNCIEFNYGKNFLKKECSNKDIFVVMEPYKYLNYDDSKIDNIDYFKTNIDNLPNNSIDMISIKNRDGINTEKYNMLQFKKSGLNELMVNDKKATKLNSLEIISEYFKISKENIVSFGDDYSDIEVFENSGISVAMGNAIPELKKIATDITDDNNSDGIAKFINKLFC